MNIVIVGGGKVGFFLAERLAEKNYVTLIEKDPHIARQVSGNSNILTIEGDGCRLEVLVQAGIRNADVVAAVTGADEDNLIICQLAKDVFNVKRTVARINDPKNEKTFARLGVDVAVDSTAIIAKIIEEEVSLEDITNLFAFKKGNLSLIRIDLPETSPVLNKSLKEITLPLDTALVAVLRSNSLLIPKADFRFCPGDEVIAITKVENEGEVLNALVGELK